MSELTDGDLARWLNETPVATCDRCGRKSWDPEAVDIEDRMIQPDGNPCGGRLVGSAP